MIPNDSWQKLDIKHILRKFLSGIIGSRKIPHAYMFYIRNHFISSLVLDSLKFKGSLELQRKS